MYALLAEEAALLPVIDVVGWVVFVLAIAITAAWTWYLYR